MVHLLTGGSGYLGVALARKLMGQGIAVRVYDIRRSDRLPDNAEFAEGDIRNYETLKRAMEGCEIVYHLVGIMPQAHAPRETMQAINVGGMENVLRAASDRGVKRVVFVSSSEVYGIPRSVPIAEDDPLEPIGEYGRNKVAAEKLCREFNRKRRIETVILRPPTIVGPEMDEPTFLRSMEMARRGRFLCVGAGNHRFQMSYVEDVAEACILAGQKKGIGGEAFNIGADGTLPFRQQMEETAKHLGHAPKIRAVPLWLFKGIMKVIIPMGLSPLEPDHLHLLYSDFVMDTAKARKMLGWSPTMTNLEMLIETYDWYQRTH